MRLQQRLPTSSSFSRRCRCPIRQAHVSVQRHATSAELRIYLDVHCHTAPNALGLQRLAKGHGSCKCCQALLLMAARHSCWSSPVAAPQRGVGGWPPLRGQAGPSLAPGCGAAVELHLLQHLGPHHGLVQLLLLEVKVEGACHTPQAARSCTGYQVSCHPQEQPQQAVQFLQRKCLTQR